MLKVHGLQVCVLVDECGDFVVAKDDDGLAEAWEQEIGSPPIGTRVIRAMLLVEMPESTELVVSVPVLQGKVSLLVK